MNPRRKWIGTLDNIRKFWETEVSQDHIDTGLRWYEEAHDIAVAISNHFGTDLDVVCAVLSAYSANTYWERTVTMTIKNLSFYYRYETVTGMRSTIKMVKDILDNNDADRLRGPKLRDFAQAIFTRGRHRHPVMDRWMARVWLGIMDWNGTVTEAMYTEAQEAYKQVADEIDMARAALQAGIWMRAIEYGPTRPTS